MIITGILFILLGCVVVYFTATFRYVPLPEEWVIERNYPGKETDKIIKVWKPGIHFLWFPIKPFMFIKNKLYCADEDILITIGVPDENEGGKSLIEFEDVSAGVHVQLILRVIDPIKATYEIGNYRRAAIDRVEANFRKAAGTMKLDKIMNDKQTQNKIAKGAFKDVNAAIKKWGVAVVNPGNEITILDFILDEKTIEQRDKLLAAQKDAQVKTTLAEATKQESILLGEDQGIGEFKKIEAVAKSLNITNEAAIDYLLKNKMTDAVKGSTIIATSEGGNLNTPINLAATMFAVDDTRSKNPLNLPVKKEDDMAYGIIIGISLILGGILMIIFPDDHHVPLAVIGCGTSLAIFLGIKQYWSRISSTPGISDTAKILKNGWLWTLLILLILSIVGWKYKQPIIDFTKGITTTIEDTSTSKEIKEEFFGEYQVNPSVPRDFGKYLPTGKYRVEPWKEKMFVRFSLAPGKWKDKEIESSGIFSVEPGDKACGLGGRSGIFKLYRVG